MAAESALDIVINLTGDAYGGLQKLESQVIRLAGAVASAIAVIEAITFPVKEAADFQQEMLNTQKTTNFTDQQIRQLSSSLIDLSKNVNISALDLAKIASVAGSLGLGKEGPEAIAAFADSTSRFASVLRISAETAAQDLAKITNIFGLALSEAEKVSAAFNKVSSTSTASGKELLDIVQRMGNLGGKVNLTESLGLAATAKDLGLTAEVIGTSFTKIFANMSSKAEKFASLMKITTGEWTQRVEADGLGAYQAVLAKLGSLDQATRAVDIVQLFGGGRIFSLVEKQVEDSGKILNTRLATAQDAFKKGTFSIQEQQTVLKGFNAQLDIMSNDIKAVAIAMGDAVLPALTAIVRQFAAWVSNPATQAGLVRLAESIGKIAVSVANLIGFVAGLNINFGALFGVFGAFAALKLVQTFTGIGDATALVGKSAKETVPLVERLATAYAKLATSKLSDIPAAIGGSLKSTFVEPVTAPGAQADTAIAAAKARAAAAQLEADKAVAEAAAAEAAAIKAADDEIIASNFAAAEAARLSAEEQALAADKAALSAQLSANIQNRAVLSQIAMQRTLAVEAKGAAAINQAIAEGASEEQISVIEASALRSIAKSEAYWAKRIAIEEAGFAKLKLIAKENLASQEAVVDTVATSKLASARAAAAAKANSAVTAEAATGLGEAAGVLSAKAAGEASKAAFTVIQAGFVRIVGVVGALVSRLFIVGTVLLIIKSIADLTGVTDFLVKKFQDLTDALGFTNKAMRDSAAAVEAANAELAKQQDQIDTLLDSYNKLIEAQGIFSGKDFSAALAKTNVDAKASGDAITNLLDRAEKIQGAQKAATQIATTIAAKGAGSKERITELENQLKQAEEKLASEQQTKANNPSIVNSAFELASQVAPSAFTPSGETEAQIKQLTTAIAVAKAEAKTFDDALHTNSNSFKITAADARATGQALSTIFTPKTYKALTDFLIPIAQAEASIKNLKETLKSTTDQKQKESVSLDIAIHTEQLDKAKADYNEFKKTLSLDERALVMKVDTTKGVEGLQRLQGALDGVRKNAGVTGTSLKDNERAFTGSALPNYTQEIKEAGAEYIVLASKLPIFQKAAEEATRAAQKAMDEYKNSVEKAKQTLQAFADFRDKITANLADRSTERAITRIQEDPAQVQAARIGLAKQQFDALSNAISKDVTIDAATKSANLAQVAANYQKSIASIKASPAVGADAASALKDQAKLTQATIQYAAAITNLNAIRDKDVAKPGSVDPKEIEKAQHAVDKLTASYEAAAEAASSNKSEDLRHNFLIPDSLVEGSAAAFDLLVAHSVNATSRLAESTKKITSDNADKLNGIVAQTADRMGALRDSIKANLDAINVPVNFDELITSLKGEFGKISSLGASLKEDKDLQSLTALDFSKVKLPDGKEVTTAVQKVVDDIKAQGLTKTNLQVGVEFKEDELAGLAPKLSTEMKNIVAAGNKVNVEIVPKAADDSVNRIQTQINQQGEITIRVTAQIAKVLGLEGQTLSVTTGAQAHAKGGLIHGPGTGTSDSIPAWLSKGEFVVNAATTEAVGPGFFYGLQSAAKGGTLGASDFLSTPLKFATGGYVAGQAGNTAINVLQQAQKDTASNGETVNLNLTIGNNTVKLKSDRDNAKTLARTLTELSRGIA